MNRQSTNYCIRQLKRAKQMFSLQKQIVSFIFIFNSVIFSYTYSQTSNKDLCQKTYSDLNLKIDLPCDGKVVEKTDSSLSFRFTLASEFNIPDAMELADFNYKKKAPFLITVENFLSIAKKESEIGLQRVKKDSKISYEYGYSDGIFKPKIEFKDNRLTYIIYTYLESESSDSRSLFYDEISLIYDRGAVVGAAQTIVLKALFSSAVDLFKDNPYATPGRVRMYTLPRHLDLIKREPYIVSNSTLGLRFELFEHYLNVTENTTKKELKIDFAYLGDENIRKQYKLRQPVTIKWVKKMTTKDKFQTVVGQYLGKALSDYDFNRGDKTKFSQFKNVFYKIAPGELSPYGCIFEINGNVYELETNIYYWPDTEKILSSMEGINIVEPTIKSVPSH